MSSLTSIGIYTLLLYLVYKFILTPAVVSPLSKIPNAHFTAPVLPIWVWWKRRQSVMNKTTLALHRKLGPIVRLGPNELSVNSAEGLRTIYTNTSFDKTTWYRDIFQNFNVPNLVSMEKREPHSAQKRLISNIYSKSYLQNSRDMLKISNEIICNRLLPVLDEAARSDTAMEVLAFSKALGMDFTSAYLFGLSNGTDFVRDKAGRDQWLEMYDKTKYQSPEEREFGDVEQWCFDLCKTAELFENEGASVAEDSTSPIVHRSLWMPLQQRSGSKSDHDNRVIVASEMLDHLIAGHETTGSTITYMMYELSRNPGLMAKLRAEVLRLTPPIKTGSTNLPPPNAVDALPLLDAIVRETLRVYAAAASPQPRVSPPSRSTVIEGYTIPGGVTVSSSAYTLHRNPKVFPDPETWEPSRWLNAEKAQLDEMKRWFWPFGSGGRMCLGSHFAMQGIISFPQCNLGFLAYRIRANNGLLELKLIAATIYTSFTTFVIDDKGIEQADSFIASPVSNRLILGFKHIV